MLREKKNQAQIVGLEQRASFNPFWLTLSWAAWFALCSGTSFALDSLTGGFNNFPRCAAVPFPPSGNPVGIGGLGFVGKCPGLYLCSAGSRKKVNTVPCKVQVKLLRGPGMRPGLGRGCMGLSPVCPCNELVQEVGLLDTSRRAEGLFWAPHLGNHNLNPHSYGKMASCDILKSIPKMTRT